MINRDRAENQAVFWSISIQMLTFQYVRRSFSLTVRSFQTVICSRCRTPSWQKLDNPTHIVTRYNASLGDWAIALVAFDANYLIARSHLIFRTKLQRDHSEDLGIVHPTIYFAAFSSPPRSALAYISSTSRCLFKASSHVAYSPSFPAAKAS